MNNEKKILLEIKNLKKYFPIKGKGTLYAVDDISFNIHEGETVGLVGESGCGKSTVGNVILGLLPATGGKVIYDNINLVNLSRKERLPYCKKVQIVFQDPYSSLNPKKTIKQILSEAFIIHKVGNKDEVDGKVRYLCDITGIEEALWVKYPHELDGGKRQVVGIARALALNPSFIVCDEPVSSLDVSIQAKIINLLIDLREKLNLTYLFISHDLSVVRHISNRVAVMYLGRIVELAETDDIFNSPKHPYTEALLSAVLNIDMTQNKEHIVLEGDVPTPINPKPGCRFAPRCRFAKDICFKDMPELKEAGEGHYVSCHLFSEK